ncbi:MAG: prolyl oligopeptidase family serine peptidase [Verrucomicrobiae bacterium]|nr:prolyl oligopeptidase family serine peptidase [Verrucomicrobiae bacterium]
MKLRNLTLLFICLISPMVSAEEEPSWLKGMDDFKWINEAPEKMHPSVFHLTFHSQANDVDVGFYVRLPRGYDAPENRNRRFPVIYFLHGGRPGSEAKSANGYQNMMNFLKSEEYPPAFMIGVNGGKLSHYDYYEYKGETAFLELVKFVDQRFRTIADRTGRVVMGSSQGGRGTGRYIFKFPELIGTAVALSGGHQHEKRIHENEGVESDYMTIPDKGRNNTFNNASLYANRKNAPPVNLMIVIGDKDDNYVGNLQWSIHLKELGIPHQLVVVPGAGHGVNWSIEHTDTRIYNFIRNGLTQN